MPTGWPQSGLARCVGGSSSKARGYRSRGPDGSGTRERGSTRLASHKHDDPRVTELLQLDAYLVHLDRRLEQYKVNHKAEVVKTRERIRELYNDLRGLTKPQNVLWAVTDGPRTGEKSR